MPEMRLCPICVHLNNWYGTKVRHATHGAGGPDWQWSACFEHYKVLTAAQWLGIATYVPAVPAARRTPNEDSVVSSDRRTP